MNIALDQCINFTINPKRFILIKKDSVKPEGKPIVEEINKLLFEMSSAERMTIMTELQKHSSKLSQISRKLNMSIAETSRHLQRLSDGKLIQKSNSGLHKLTQFGSIALALLSGIQFLSEHRKYFLEYDAAAIPYDLINRIGELEKSIYVPETLKNLEEGENKIREAQELVWILTDEILTSSISPLIEKTKKHFDLRIILPEGKFPPENKSRLPKTSPNIQKRVLPKIDVVIVLTEKDAVFCLPNRDGKIDYTGFTGNDPKFHKWCKDLFLHYWEKAKPPA